jgi:hypothetical protein
MITISCECGKRYHVKDEAAGKRAKCSCGKMFVIPQPCAASISPNREIDRGTSIHVTSKSPRRYWRSVTLGGIPVLVLLLIVVIAWVLNLSHGQENAGLKLHVRQESNVGDARSEKNDKVSTQPGKALATAETDADPMDFVSVGAATQQNRTTAQATKPTRQVSLADFAGHWYGMSTNGTLCEMLIDDRGEFTCSKKGTGNDGPVVGKGTIEEVSGRFSLHLPLVFLDPNPFKLYLSDDGRSLSLASKSYGIFLRRQMPNGEAKAK